MLQQILARFGIDCKFEDISNTLRRAIKHKQQRTKKNYQANQITTLINSNCKSPNNTRANPKNIRSYNKDYIKI